ncbi:hypothetical protein Tco_0050666 [Tanacetum coccineum]
MCKEAALSKELRDLSFCSAVPIAGYYKNYRKRYGKDILQEIAKAKVGILLVYQELDIPKEWDIVSADFSDKSSVYSISEGEGEFQGGFRRLRGQRYNNTLESMVNPEQQLAISGRRRAQLAPAEVLYSYHRSVIFIP